ncbi:MAG: nucleotidyltransferase domain-containing protein [Syntrophomonas sp.]|uniref:nucleotidyltransferase family protein n=1 Tax=Syntrophomonas sp. TaxID=2053627 RepID=UPI00261DF0A4|nr:nucleotidyltransferase domain-containing protein [Syntrophomonas sp.]MDD2510682.1 nucleotidyltransferase domain-containing protein [Syntrophomonas sp.]MDD3878702.1 nucleotidyltransferase domain-containing protein [Syntrophomonas sp.]MDD4626162.1 nucleotidyltransferase domain-containing protein [Syntrophomonas sp.]
MTITDIKNAVNQVAPAYPVFSIDLFGSYANDENTEKSDIDFLVYFDEKFASLFDMSGLKLDIQERLNTQVEMLLEKSYTWLYRTSPKSGLCPSRKFVRPEVCHQIPSDSTSRWTPLPLAMCLALSTRTRDFHPLDCAHAGRTEKGADSLNCPPPSQGFSP